MKARPDFVAMANPYDLQEQIAVAPAIGPDVAVFHGFRGDRAGNVVTWGQLDAKLIAQAAHRVIATVSPIPASTCLLAQATHAPRARFILLGGPERVFFGSGTQIDETGAFNLCVIGDPARPKVRLPGGRAQGVLPFVIPRTILFRTDHSRRVFVPRVDFVTAPGASPPGVYRRSGVSEVVSDLAVAPPPTPHELALLRGPACEQLGAIYPEFAKRQPA